MSRPCQTSPSQKTIFRSWHSAHRGRSRIGSHGAGVASRAPPWGRRVAAPSPDSGPSNGDHDKARGNKAQVPGELALAGMNMVNAQYLMIDDAFDRVEEAPAQEKRADEGARRPRDVRALPGAPEPSEAGGRHDPGEGVEQAVPDHIVFHRHE